MQDRHRRTFAFNKPVVLWPIIFHDDCEGTFLWRSDGTGADWTGDYDATIAFVGSHSLRLQTKTTDPAIDDYVKLTKNLWAPPHKRVTLTLCFFRQTGTNSDIFAMLYWYDGTNAHCAAIKFLTAGAAVQYLDSGAIYQTIPGWKWNTGVVHSWNFLSYSLNLVKNQYAEVTVNHQTMSLAGTSYALSENATPPYLELHLMLETKAANQAGCRMDQILFRGDNP